MHIVRQCPTCKVVVIDKDHASQVVTIRVFRRSVLHAVKLRAVFDTLFGGADEFMRHLRLHRQDVEAAIMAEYTSALPHQARELVDYWLGIPAPGESTVTIGIDGTVTVPSEEWTVAFV